jgi:glycosyltransferase involved in cell wall biosynthesis
MKKIIFISGIQIFPPESGGQLRSANICRALTSHGFEVEIYSFTGRKKDYKKLFKSSEVQIDMHLTEFTNRNLLLGLIQFIFYKLKLPPFWLTWLTKIYIPKELKLKINQSESVLLDFPYLYPISSYSKKTFRLNTHNAEFELFTEHPKISKMVKKIELKSFESANHVFFCNTNDQKKFLAEFPKLESKSSLLPNGVDLSLFQFNEEWRNTTREKLKIAPHQKVFLFTGSQYLPNIEAFNFLRSWSETNAQYLAELNIVILIVGTVSLNLIDEPHFKVVGKVGNIMPFFWASDYGINPVATGSGTNVKMIEFLASNLPILTTPFGARGLELTDRESCFYFEANNLLQVIKEAMTQDLKQRQVMAATALKNNLRNVDMTKALQSLNIRW